jgi:two-component system response regulator QseB
MRILIVEDDTLLAEGIAVSLQLAGHTADCVGTGEHALQALLSESFDLCILDLGLPKMSGYEVLKQVRAKRITLPVLILTARDQISDKVKGLDAGADDYLLKPFDVEELKARIRALMRRGKNQPGNEVLIGNLTIRPEQHQVFVGAEEIKLSPREFTLLHELALHRGRVL